MTSQLPTTRVSLLDPKTVDAVMDGSASPEERAALLRVVADVCRWREGECQTLDLWGDCVEMDATAQVIEAALRARAESARAPFVYGFAGAASPLNVRS